MKVKIFVLWYTLFICALCACNKSDVDEKWAKEETDLKEWMKENKPDLQLENGIYIEKIGSSNEKNTQPEAGDHVLVNFVCTFLFDDVIEQVSYKDWQARGALYPSTYREGGPELWTPEMWINKGIGQLREKERAHVYIPSRILGFQDFKTRRFEIELVQVIDTLLKNYQEGLMGRYMRKFCKVDTITIPINGKDHYIIYSVEDEGSGDAVNVSSVKTHYDEYYYLQNNRPKECAKDQLKTGWDRTKFSEMFQKVKKGGKITVMMPYRVMYGDNSYMDSNKQYIAPPGSVLRYEIRIDP